MATLSLSDQILLELSKRSQPMTAQRLAGAISHDLSKTRALIQFMARNDKLCGAGPDGNREQTYSLTAHGRSLAAKIEGAGGNPGTAAPQPLGRHDPRPLLTQHTHTEVANVPEPRLMPVTEPPATPHPKGTTEPQSMLGQIPLQKPAQADDQIARSVPTLSEYFNRPRCLQHRFGILNSGELAIIGPNNNLVAMLCQDELNALRQALDSRP